MNTFIQFIHQQSTIAITRDIALWLINKHINLTTINIKSTRFNKLIILTKRRKDSILHIRFISQNILNMGFNNIYQHQMRRFFIKNLMCQKGLLAFLNRE
jgi:hypothetical protein